MNKTTNNKTKDNIMAKIDISKLSDTELFELLEKGKAEEQARLLKNLEPMKQSVTDDLAKIQETVVAILKIDPNYTAPFTVNRLERTQENVLALLKDISMTRTEVIRKLSGSSKVVGEFIDELVKSKVIKETKGTTSKGIETYSYTVA